MVKNIFGFFSSKKHMEENNPMEKVEIDVADVAKESAVKKFSDKKDVNGNLEVYNLTENDSLFVKDFTQKIIDAMGFMSVTKVVSYSGNEILLDIKSDEVGRIIGKEGNTINSLQFLVRNALQRKIEKNCNVILDANNYRDRRREALEKKAERAAKSAIEKNREIKMGPMCAFDRRILHLTLENNSEIVTFSKGDKNNRQVIVAPKK